MTVSVLPAILTLPVLVELVLFPETRTATVPSPMPELPLVTSSHVTVLGMPLRPGAVAAIAGRIADTGANIDRIERMARYPVTAIELHVSGADPDRLRVTLSEEAARQEADRRNGSYRHHVLTELGDIELCVP